MHNSDEHEPAKYATPSNVAIDRVHDEPVDRLRSPFEFDRHRVIESMAFRRLEQKTQVFGAAHHDHFRTRLTHTLEVASLARTLARLLSANESLAEVIALAHDLGHPPFGHAAEQVLDQLMVDYGGFNHNLHSLRVVEYLEHPFPAFRGLNLTAATRAGLASHCTQFDTPAESDQVSRVSSVEGQIASVADRIAYDHHDLEDAIGAGFVDLEQLADVPLWQEAINLINAEPQANIHAIRRVVLDTMLSSVITDVVEASTHRVESTSSAAVAQPTVHDFVAPSAVMEHRLAALERLLNSRVYNHPDVVEMDTNGGAIVRALFGAYLSDPSRLPPRFAARLEIHGPHRVICDYIAGMTDRFCMKDHDRVVHAAD